MSTTKHTGGCHCGAIRFEVELDFDFLQSGRCNCSICTKIGATSTLTKPSAFRLASDDAKIGWYEWGGKISKRAFCKECGVHCFGVGHLAEVGGDYVSINLNVLDRLDPNTLKPVHWDGRHDNWEAGPKSTPWPIFG